MKTMQFGKSFINECNKVATSLLLSSTPTAKDFDLQRVIAAITFWYSDNSIVVNMMGVAVEDKDFGRLYDDVLDSPNRIIDWRGKGVGVFLLRLIYVYYKQLYPLSCGTTFLQVHGESLKAIRFFEKFGFVATPPSDNNQSDMLEALKQHMDATTFSELSSIWETGGFNKHVDENLVLMYRPHPSLEEMFASIQGDDLEYDTFDAVDEIEIMKPNRRVTTINPVTKKDDGNIRLKGLASKDLWARFPLNVHFKTIEEELQTTTYASIKDLKLPDESNVLYAHTKGRFNTLNYCMTIDERMKKKHFQYLYLDSVDLYMSILLRNNQTDKFRFMLLPSSNLRRTCDSVSKTFKKEKSTLSEIENHCVLQAKSNILDYCDHIENPSLIKFLFYPFCTGNHFVLLFVETTCLPNSTQFRKCCRIHVLLQCFQHI